MGSLFSHLNNLGIISGNPFLAIDNERSFEDNYHSRVLNIIDLYKVYKAAHELNSEGISVLIPVLVDIFTGLRSTSLKKLKIRSISNEFNGLIYKFSKNNDKKNTEFKLDPNTNEENISNRKNKDFFLPLPPKLMNLLQEVCKERDPEEPLLYGLKGKPFANKQMNYITDKICEHLDWIKVNIKIQPKSIIDVRIKRNKKWGRKFQLKQISSLPLMGYVIQFPHFFMKWAYQKIVFAFY